MTKFRKILGRPAVTAVLFVLAVGLLLGGTIGGARAALKAESEYVNSAVSLPAIGIALVENGNTVSNGEIMNNILDGDEHLIPGKRYSEELSVRNDGSIDEYVRVSIYMYWENAAGEKQPDEKWDSRLIEPRFLEENGWHIISKPVEADEERTVMYYSKPLAPGETSPEFMDSLVINNAIMEKVEQTKEVNGNLTTITTTYLYNGAHCRICVYADGLQTHNAVDAVKSSWGYDATVSGGELTITGGGQS